MTVRFVGVLMIICLVGCVDSAQLRATPVPIATLTSVPTAPTASPIRVQSRFITDKSTNRLYWTSDGKSIVYAETEKCPTGCKVEEQWHQLDVETGVVTRFKPVLTTVESDTWKLLGQSGVPPEITPDRNKNVSPDGRRLLYNRISSDYDQPTCTRGPCLSPMEVWMARVNGTDQIKIGNSGSGVWCSVSTWFEQGHKAIMMCGYEGPAEFFIADTIQHTLKRFSEMTHYDGAALDGHTALSPDEKRFALSDLTPALKIVPLDGGPVVTVSLRASQPQWSASSQQLYYMRMTTPAKCTPATIRVFDLTTNEDEIVVGPDVTLAKDHHVTLDYCHNYFQLSPQEDAVLLDLGGEGKWVVPLSH